MSFPCCQRCFVMRTSATPVRYTRVFSGWRHCVTVARVVDWGARWIEDVGGGSCVQDDTERVGRRASTNITQCNDILGRSTNRSGRRVYTILRALTWGVTYLWRHNVNVLQLSAYWYVMPHSRPKIKDTIAPGNMAKIANKAFYAKAARMDGITVYFLTVSLADV